MAVLCAAVGCARGQRAGSEDIHADPARADALADVPHTQADSLDETAAARSGLISNQVAIGDYHTCAVTPDSAVMCWGRNIVGQIGDGTDEDRSTPMRTARVSATAIALGGFHSCALTVGGGVSCWGDNYHGQLGDGGIGNRRTPVPVTGLSSGVTAIAAGGARTCAVIVSGAVKCWGENAYGELGDGTEIERHQPSTVIGLASATAVAVGTVHTCALTAAGAVRCWGDNQSGAVGDGTKIDRRLPVSVSGLGSGAVAITAGFGHSCALTSTGGVKCWGDNGWGQLGDGTTTDRHTPVDVVGLTSGVAAIAAGGNHTCALTSVGGVLCWGTSHDGVLGDGETTDGSDRERPVPVRGLSSGVISISAGQYNACAVTAAHVTKCWGKSDYGQLGDGVTPFRSYAPVTVAKP